MSHHKPGADEKDYIAKMTDNVFEEYFQQMIEHIPAESVIVSDNTPYHSRLLERLPTNSWKKELIKIAKQNKAQFKKYAVDEVTKKRNVTVLRLPPYPCELNSIESIFKTYGNYYSTEKWHSAYYKEEENKMWNLDEYIEETVETVPLIINLRDSISLKICSILCN
ncbi:hypothetical protein NQ318_015430 [Aromia moschata]|uniref:Tc1-like transposase DDE domain-containing protein n=1 Tax=Aromia moschata TaxID=1265417 RepID=A0AAV8YPX6_9CUCU|nr:hypothetical protein NQ318_015430 [Aromia moschata]